MIGTNIVFVALAALCWGLSCGIGSILMTDGWDPYVVTFYRGAIGLFIFLVWLILRPHGSGLKNHRLWFWSAIAGLGVAGNFSFYLISVAQCSIAVVVTLMYCAPIFVYLVSFALKLESPSAMKWAAIAIVMLGIVLLTQVYDIGECSVTIFGAGAGLLAGLSYAIFIFGFKYATRHGSPQAILSIAFVTLTATLFWPGSVELNVKFLSAPGWPLVVGLGVFGAGLAFVLYLTGLKHTGPALASIIAMVEPVTASLFGVVFLNENLVAPQIVGMGLIITTVTALSVFSSTEKKLPNPHSPIDT